MYRKLGFLLAIGMVLSLFGCGGLRYNMMLPEGKTFHPQRIIVLPVAIGPFAEAEGIIDQAIVTGLTQKKWYSRVVSEETAAAASPKLRETVTAYLDKLEKLNYSDPVLSREIAVLSQVDALLIVSLDYWNYMQDADTKFGRVGLGMRMVNAETGSLAWEARHLKSVRYLVIKPDLSDIAISLTREMAGYMPR